MSSIDLCKGLLPRLGRPSMMIGSRGRLSAYAIACKRAGIEYLPTRTYPSQTSRTAHRAGGRAPSRPIALAEHTSPHTLQAKARSRRLREWIRRFNGVATRYLEHYLRWHLAVDREPESDTWQPHSRSRRSLTRLRERLGIHYSTNISRGQRRRASESGRFSAADPPPRVAPATDLTTFLRQLFRK